MSKIKLFGKRGLTLFLAIIMSVSLIIPTSVAEEDIDDINDEVECIDVADDSDIDEFDDNTESIEDIEDTEDSYNENIGNDDIEDSVVIDDEPEFENAIVPLIASDELETFAELEPGGGSSSATTVTAFAVYSTDDYSLTFYTDTSVPEQGSIYNDKAATYVYTGFDSTTYSSSSSVPWYSYRTSITSVVIDKSFNKCQPIALRYWFYGFTNATFSGLENIDTSSITTLYYTFYNCSKLENVDGLAEWNTSKVTTLQYTFYNCSSLTNVDGLAGWDTSAVTNMQYTFYGCSKLENIDGLAGWDTSKVTTLQYTFCGCSKLENVDGLAGWDTSSVTTLYGTFYSCSNLTNVDGLAGWDTSAVTTLQYTFRSCSSLTNVDKLAGWETSSVTTLYGTFFYCSSLTNVDGLANWNTSAVTTLQYTFENCSNLTNVDGLAGWNTSKVTSLRETFYGCSSLTTMDLSSWDTSNVTNMGSTFYGCSKLETIYVSEGQFNTDKVTSGSNMFYNCSKLVGGVGTKYDSSKTTYTMAHIDTYDDPGYFTLFHDHEWIEIDTQTDSTHISVTFECTVCGLIKHETVMTEVTSDSGLTGSFDIGDFEWHELISEEEMEALDDNAVIDFVVDLEDINGTVSDDDSSLVKHLLEGERADVFYLSIDMSMVVTSGDDTESYELHDLQQPITITVSIPESIQTDKNGDYTIIRVHDDEAKELSSTADKDKWTITFQTDKFSTYAIVFLRASLADLAVVKVDANNHSTMLSGASFTLMNEDGLYYNSDDDGEAVWQASAVSFMTDSNGTILFYGLDDGTYTLTETKAPDGYNPLTDYITFTSTDGIIKLSSSSDYIWQSDNDIYVANDTGNILSEAGGFGAWSYVVGGFVLAIVATVTIVINRRKKIQN